ncbi:MAG: cardiolipin synthase [Defluviitaleaceae bacterium]|nr:cardiolipin synthase [Defluviitaleaceae bacterium]
MTAVGLVLSPISLINIVFAALVVYAGRRNPGITWAWLFVILMLPYLGIVLYMLLGFDGRRHATFAAKRIRDADVFSTCSKIFSAQRDFLNEQMDVLKRPPIADELGSASVNDMVYLNMVSGGAAFTEGNDVQIFAEGGTKFDSLLADIAGARHSVFVQYYIVRNDSLTRRIVQALAARACEGVRVCILLDGMGCLFTPRSVFTPLVEAGGNVATFMPPKLGALNYRNHRKIAVIDGKVGYVGGLNIGEEYLGLARRFGFWRDAHLRIRGDAVHHLTLRFLMDWNFAHKKDPLPIDADLFPSARVQPGDCAMQIISSGPDTQWPSVQYAYLKMISGASSQILIQSPYFVPDDSVLEALRLAALSGVDVRIMIPAHPDHPFVYWAALSYLGELLDVGVRCFKYERGFMHSKAIVADERVASVGTANLDVRSFRLNFEINAIIYNRRIASDLAAQFHKDVEDCTEITKEWYAARSRVFRIREAVSRLLSPIL